MSRRFSVLFVLAILVSGLMPGYVEAQQPEWMAPLTRQVREKENCTLMFMTRVHEYRLFDKDVVEGRVHCEDGRSFDVIRKDRGRRFEIHSCEPVICEVTKARGSERG